MARVAVDQSTLSEFCRKQHILRLALFGSAVHGYFAPDSDLNVLVEFGPGHVPGLEFFAMEAELSQLLGRKVDLNTPGFLTHTSVTRYWPKPRCSLTRRDSSLRIRLIYGYDAVDKDILWQIIVHNLPPLIAALERILSQDEPDASA